jgi:DNA-binding PadR family transcriptional regulator
VSCAEEQLPVGERVYEELEDDSGASEILGSQVACAVLGLVIEKPSHGYEIAQRFEGRFGAFLGAGRSAIYATLASLLSAGLIEKMPGRSTTGATRGAKAGAPYRATPRGARAFRASLAERIRRDPQRVDMLGRMTLAGVHSVDAALDFISRYEQECMQEARQVAQPDGREKSGSHVSGLIGRLLIEERRRMIDAQLGWITYARAALRAVAQSEEDGGGRL